MTVEGMTIINTETWALILLCDKSTWPTPWARTFFDDVPFKHIMDTFINDSLSSRVGSVWGAIDRKGVKRKCCFRVGATTKL